ncbi:MAG: hypothetical protein KAX49_18810 [Halanaerobiales bacterium]|nr:hypothetical protein [Halanaerobiales bacterium]
MNAGNKRELHTEKAMKVAKVPHVNITPVSKIDGDITTLSLNIFQYSNLMLMEKNKLQLINRFFV